MRISQLISTAFVAAACFLGLAPGAASASSEWRGGGFVTDFRGCEEYGWSGAHRMMARFRPAGLPGNDPFWTRASIMFSNGQMNFFFPQDFELIYAYQDVESTISWTGVWSPSEPMQQMRFTRGTDAGPDALASGLLEAYGNIENFDGLEGCNARFGFVLAPR